MLYFFKLFKNINKPSLVITYTKTISLFKNHPILMLPFFIFACIDCLVLTIIFLAPRQPLLPFLGPIIITFWGEKFLHYPYNLLLLPKLEYFSRMGLSVVFASLLTGMAVAMIHEAHMKKPIHLGRSFKSAMNKYVYLFIAVFFFTGLFYLIIRLVNAGLIHYFLSEGRSKSFLMTQVGLGPIILCVDFFIAMFIQAAYNYVIPTLMLEKKKFFRSLADAFLLFERLCIFTFLLVGIPLLSYIPIIIFNFNTMSLIQSFFPELVLIISFLGIIVSDLFINPIITASATLVFLETRENS